MTPVTEASSSSTASTTKPTTTAPSGKKRGRPAKSRPSESTDATDTVDTKRPKNFHDGNAPGAVSQQEPLNRDADDDAASDTETNDGSDDDENDVLDEFTAGALIVPSTTVPKPDFGDSEHMWFQTTQVAHMSTLFKALSSLLSQSCVVLFSPNGWRITSMNAPHTAMVVLRVTNHTMVEGLYECNFNYRITLPIEEFSNRLKMRRRAEVMSMSLQGTKPDTMRLEFSSGKRTTEMDLLLRNDEDDQADMPKLEYHSQIDIPAESFREDLTCVRSDTLINDVTFTKTSRRFTITVKTGYGPIRTHYVYSDDGGDSAQYKRYEAADISVDDNDAVVSEATFSLNELIAFTGVTKAAKYVQLFMPEEGAEILMIKYSLAALGEVSFFLAPKIVDSE